MIGEPIIGTYWREQYLEVKRQRDEARAEVEHLIERLRQQLVDVENAQKE